MKKPEYRKGYTNISNDLMDNICKLPLNGTDIKVILCIFRYTAGVGRKSCKLSGSSIAKWGNCDLRAVLKGYCDISDTLKRGSGEMRHSRKHKKTATVRDNDGMRCEAAAVRGSFSSVGAKHIKCNNIIIYIKTPHSRKGLLFGRICWIS